MKKKEVITRDYTDQLKAMEEREDELTQEMKEILERMRQAGPQKKRAYIISPYAAARFEKTIEACDNMMKEFSGKLKATVDYESHHATIEMECVYIEFRAKEFMTYLHDMVTWAEWIEFCPLLSGFLRVSIGMPYFVPLGIYSCE